MKKISVVNVKFFAGVEFGMFGPKVVRTSVKHEALVLHDKQDVKNALLLLKKSHRK